MTNVVYEASVYSRTVSYKNFKGETKTQELHFALDPLQLMQVFSSFEPKKVKSGNPALAGKEAPITDEQQVKMIRDLVIKAVGFPSDDGESWEPFVGFENTLAGKAFLTKLTASDADRREFSEKVILDPLRAFIGYAEADESNSKAEVAQFKQMLGTVEKLFATPDPASETYEEKRARLAAEMAALEQAGSNVVPPAES